MEWVVAVMAYKRGHETEHQAGLWAGLLHTCHWALTSLQSHLAGQAEGLGPGTVLFCWPSMLSFRVCYLGGLNLPTLHRVGL